MVLMSCCRVKGARQEHRKERERLGLKLPESDHSAARRRAARLHCKWRARWPAATVRSGCIREEKERWRALEGARSPARQGTSGAGGEGREAPSWTTPLPSAVAPPAAAWPARRGAPAGTRRCKKRRTTRRGQHLYRRRECVAPREKKEEGREYRRRECAAPRERKDAPHERCLGFGFE